MRREKAEQLFRKAWLLRRQMAQDIDKEHIAELSIIAARFPHRGETGWVVTDMLCAQR
jgi:hypothetical protein